MGSGCAASCEPKRSRASMRLRSLKRKQYASPPERKAGYSEYNRGHLHPRRIRVRCKAGCLQLDDPSPLFRDSVHQTRLTASVTQPQRRQQSQPVPLVKKMTAVLSCSHRVLLDHEDGTHAFVCCADPAVCELNIARSASVPVGRVRGGVVGWVARVLGVGGVGG